MEAIAETVPAATTATSESAATAQPVETVTTETPTRPTSMRDALLQADKPAVDASAQPDGATIPPADATTTDAAKPAGPIPFEKHQRALDNARTKAVEEFRAANPLSTLPVETQREWSITARQMHSDPVTFTRTYLDAVKVQNPQAFAAIQKELGASFQPAPVDAMPEPDVEIVNAQNQVVGKTYSAEQLAKRDAWTKRQTMGEIDERYKPLLDEREKKVAADRQAEVAKQTEQQTNVTLTHVAAILKLPKDSPKERTDAIYRHVVETMDANPGMDARDAAALVYDKHVAPSLAEHARLAAIDTQKRKAAGNTSVGTGVAASPTRPRNPKELAAFMAQQP